jgi:dolichol-phosphate mannosyltransferase
MSAALQIDVVIPVFNEKENIEKTFDALARGIRMVDPALAVFRLMPVYDFDEDNTLPVINSIRSRYPFPVSLVKNPKRGVVNAIRQGIASATGDYILVTMADCSDDYEILPDLVDLAGKGYDIVTPSRYMRGGRLHGGPFFKQFLSRMAGVTICWLCRIPTHDITNSYKLYRCGAIRQLVIESMGGFEIGMEIAAKVFAGGGRICEVPTQWWDRTEGKSNFKLFKWLPHYLKWYLFLLKRRPLGLGKGR